MKQEWSESHDACALAFWELFEAGEGPAAIKRNLDARFEGVPSRSTIAYRLDRARIRPVFVRVVVDEERITRAFERFERERNKKPVPNPATRRPLPVQAGAPETFVEDLLPARPRYLCVGKDNTCPNRREVGAYCAGCGSGIYQSPEEKNAWNTVVANQVGSALGRLRRD